MSQNYKWINKIICPHLMNSKIFSSVTRVSFQSTIQRWKPQSSESQSETPKTCDRWKHILGIRAQSADLPQVTLVTCMFTFIFHSCSFIVSDECFRKLWESSRKHADLLNFVNFAEAFRKYFSKVYENSRSSPMMMMNWQVYYRQLISASTHEASRTEAESGPHPPTARMAQK